ncbi:MAG: hypothetical protein ACK559_06890 [bacterium]
MAATTSWTYAATSAMKRGRASCPSSIRARRSSHWPVSAGLFSPSTGTASISEQPRGVARRSRPSRST